MSLRKKRTEILERALRLFSNPLPGQIESASERVLNDLRAQTHDSLPKPYPGADAIRPAVQRRAFAYAPACVGVALLALAVVQSIIGIQLGATPKSRGPGERLPTEAAFAVLPGTSEALLSDEAVTLVARKSGYGRDFELVSKGGNPWRIPLHTLGRPTLLRVSTDRVLLFGLGTLYLVDTQRGVVVGRWIFCGGIWKVEVHGTQFTVTTFDASEQKRTAVITAESGPQPCVPSSLLAFRGAAEAGSWITFDSPRLLPTSFVGPDRQVQAQPMPLPIDQARKFLVEAQDAAQRNPFSTQLAVYKALVMRDAGLKESEAAFEEALDHADFFGELLWLSHALDDIGEREWAARVFDRGYGLLWNAGLDPRQITFRQRYILGAIPQETRYEIPDQRRNQLVERDYLLGPYTSRSSMVWKAWAEYLSSRGDRAAAELWRARSSEAATREPYHAQPMADADWMIRLCAALIAAPLVYTFVLDRRYARELRRLRQESRGEPWYRRLMLPASCWNRYERRAAYLVIAIQWLAAGYVGYAAEARYRHWGFPDLGAEASANLERLNTFPPSADHDLLRAFFLQKANNVQEAELAYRQVEKSSIAWNNLGVLQANAGRDTDARASFERALQIDSTMPEAAFNLGRPVDDFWARIHGRYLPGKKMLAIPPLAVFDNAVQGTWLRRGLRIVQGPILTLGTIWNIHQGEESIEMFPIGPVKIWTILTPLWYLGAYGSVALALTLMASPYRTVTQAPGRLHFIWALIVPGTSEGWGRLGGLVLAVALFCGLVMQFPVSFIEEGGPLSYFLPPSIDQHKVWLSEVSGFWKSSRGATGILACAYALNFILVVRERWKQA